MSPDGLRSYVRTGVGPAPRIRAVVRRARVASALVAVSALLILAACSSDDSKLSATQPATTGDGNYVLFNQNWVEGLLTEGLNLTDVDAIFTTVFAALPDEVTVYPSENYYYFIIHVDGRQVWGNIRLPSGRRENGVLSFGYFEFIEFPGTTGASISGSKFFTDADGVIVTELDRFTATVRFRGKEVTFNFHQLDQTQPGSLVLDADETFIQRTFDESGYQFSLIFNERGNYFMWVLNEDETIRDILEPVGETENLLFGRRSGFAFWIDVEHGDRKVLAGVRRLNLQRNDYYDGPFDQLADNYAEETGVAAYMVRAFPNLAGRIDKYGYYTDTERPLRVAISAYFIYSAQSEMIAFVGRLAEDADPLALISRSGRPAPQ